MPCPATLPRANPPLPPRQSPPHHCPVAAMSRADHRPLVDFLSMTPRMESPMTTPPPEEEVWPLPLHTPVPTKRPRPPLAGVTVARVLSQALPQRGNVDQPRCWHRAPFHWRVPRRPAAYPCALASTAAAVAWTADPGRLKGAGTGRLATTPGCCRRRRRPWEERARVAPPPPRWWWRWEETVAAAVAGA